MAKLINGQAIGKQSEKLAWRASDNRVIIQNKQLMKTSIGGSSASPLITGGIPYQTIIITKLNHNIFISYKN